MACATLVHSQPSKRRIESVDGVDQTSKCKRSSNLDFGLSSASFGSPPRFGRSSPPFRDAGRLSPKTFAKPPGQSTPSTLPPLIFSVSSPSAAKTSDNASWSTIRTRSESSSKTPFDHEPRLTVYEVVEMCKQEMRQLDSRLRQEYEHVLQNQLAEQYQSFLLFAQDELRTNMQGIPPDADMSYIG